MRSLFALSLVSTTMAYENLNKLFESGMANFQAANGASAEEISKGITESQMGLINNYGCWCYFEENHGAGRGQPVDALDGYCKTLHDGYECIIADSVEAGIPCVPWEIAYTSAFGFGMPGSLTMEAIDTTCDGINIPNSCAAWACKVETWFLTQYFAYVTSGGAIDASKRHDNGFEPKDSCPITPGQMSERSCCGTFPARYPYKTYEGARDCCGSHTFNTSMFQCCSGDSIAISCN